MYLHTIDIAHPPLSSVTAEEVLDNELTQVRLTKKWRVLKIIHGNGTIKRPAVLKQIVQNWAYRNRAHLLAVIPGEEYNIHNPTTQEMRKLCGQVVDADLGNSNPGITILWIK